MCNYARYDSRLHHLLLRLQYLYPATICTEGPQSLSPEHHGFPDRLSIAEYVKAHKLQTLSVSLSNAWWTVWSWRYRRSELCSSLQINRGMTRACKRIVKMAPRSHAAAWPKLDVAFQTTITSNSSALFTSLTRLQTYQMGLTLLMTAGMEINSPRSTFPEPESKDHPTRVPDTGFEYTILN